MTYPTLSREAARKAFEAHVSEQPVEEIIATETVLSESGNFDASGAIDLSNALWDLVDVEPKGGFKYERLAAPEIHQRLALHPIVAGDSGFWRWLSFSAQGALAELIDWRYPSKREVYYGLGQPKKGMLNYLWLRADSVFDDTREDQYEVVRRGDVDIWQSHIVRVDFGSVRQMARSFIEYVHPSEDKQTLEQIEYRALAKELTRRNASMSYELLEDGDCHEFIDEVWKDKAAWQVQL
jgi:hypothetical protein